MKIALSCFLASSLLMLSACTSTQPTSESSVLEPTVQAPPVPESAVEIPPVEPAAPECHFLPYGAEKSKILLIGPINDNLENCGSFNTQTEMNMCALRNAETTSAQLESVKAFIADSLTETGQTSLASSQSAWMRFRDLDCDFAADQFAGGSIAPLVYGECLSDHHLNRTRELAGEGQASLSYAEADAQLNENYQSLISVVSETRAQALVDVQLAWIEYRDRHCAYEVDYSPTVTNTEEQCLARMSKLRAADLQQATEQNSL